MNPNIENLYQVAGKTERRIIGLMSGTSVDGLDVAVCKIRGSGLETEIILENFETVPYDPAFKEMVAAIFSKKDADLEKVCLANEQIGNLHGTMVLQCLQKWKIKPETIDAIASHGQTIYHAPKSLHQINFLPNGSLQIGDGDHLARRSGILTISDFRQKHMSAGGEGAPLAVYGDYLLFGNKEENRILLNIGGIANFTILPAGLELQHIFCSDLGPGNTLLDAFTKKYFQKDFDKDAAFARLGTVDLPLLKALKENPFFDLAFPKTTGPELFNLAYFDRAKSKAGTVTLSNHDCLRTLVQFSADTIANAIEKAMPGIDELRIFTSGGGIHNPVLMNCIQQLLPTAIFETTASIGIAPDAKEAVLFAILANETLHGSPQTGYTGNAAIPAVSMGKISFPR
jgi:anhydro-N-acetylmuramic acid kinase